MSEIKYNNETALKLYETGMTFKQVGEHFGVSESYARRKLFTMPGFEPRASVADSLDIKKVATMFMNGSRISDVAKANNVSVDTIKYCIYRHKLSVHDLKKKLDYDYIIARFKDGVTIASLAEENNITEYMLRLKIANAGYDLNKIRKQVGDIYYTKLRVMNEYLNPENRHVVRCRGCSFKSTCTDCWYRKIYGMGR